MEWQDRVLACLCAWAWAIHLLSCFGCRAVWWPASRGSAGSAGGAGTDAGPRRGPCPSAVHRPEVCAGEGTRSPARSWRKPCRKHAWSSERVTSHHTLLFTFSRVLHLETGCLLSWLKWSTITQKQHETESWNSFSSRWAWDKHEISWNTD